MPKVSEKRRSKNFAVPKFLNSNIDETLSSNVNIGLPNIPKWIHLKNKLNIKSDEEFVFHLLQSLENSLSNIDVLKYDSLIDSSQKNGEDNFGSGLLPKEGGILDSVFSTLAPIEKDDGCLTNELEKICPVDQENVPKESNDHKEERVLSLKVQSNQSNGKFENEFVADHIGTDVIDEANQLADAATISTSCVSSNIPVLPAPSLSYKTKKQAKENNQPTSKDTKKLKTQINEKISNDNNHSKLKTNISKTNRVVEKNNEARSKSKSEKEEKKTDGNADEKCMYCKVCHLESPCPLLNPIKKIKDSISYEDWVKGDVFVHSNSVSDSDEELNFSKCSLPECLELKVIDSSHRFSVKTRSIIPQYTEFGPLIGHKLKLQDVPEDSNMHGIWEMQNSDGDLVYLSTQNLNTSNWLTFIRPAPTQERRNLTVVTRNFQLYFVTSKAIGINTELLYWNDCFAKTWNDKKMNKDCCGGCNIKFDHSFYYRLHCQIFHDPSRSLTVRKYHCKVCGEAVLGKQNIVKHAAELHKGKGAYQCPFCNKFFLRLNYLEMHKTYGCSANPQRSKPLCDFCGRKFCQPQKLKVHIKRMHGDLTSILAEFQCMSCLRVLGSRAALQRHVKEVHNKNDRDSIMCQQCGKSFQNKSNLKIHMLTHSGIKPFRCSVAGCSSAFTTKQCLQLHYKKLHGFPENKMPEIHRTVEYTFNAYAGGNASDGHPDSPQSAEEDDNMQLSESPLLQVQDTGNMTDTSSIDITDNRDDNQGITSDQNDDTMAINCSKDYEDYNQSADDTIIQSVVDDDNCSSIVKTRKINCIESIVSEASDKYSDFSINPDSESEIETEPKLLYPFTRSESSNTTLLVEAAIDAVEKVINTDHPLNFTISHDATEVPTTVEVEDHHKAIGSPSPIQVPHFSLSSQAESVSNALDISVSSTYPSELLPAHFVPPYNLQLSPVDVVNLAQQSDYYLRKTDDISGDEADNIKNLCLSSKDRLHIDILAYKPYADNVDEKTSLLKHYDNRESRLQLLKHYSPVEDQSNSSKYELLDDRSINIPDDRLNLFKQYDLLDDCSPTLLKPYDSLEDRSNLYKLYDNVADDRTSLINFESLESMDVSRCSGLSHIYSNLQVSPPKYPRPLYGTSSPHSYSDVLRVVNLHSQSVDLSLNRPTTSSLIASSPTYSSYPLSPTLPTFLTPRSALSPSYHSYSSYY